MIFPAEKQPATFEKLLLQPKVVEGDRGAGARENRGREGYGRKEEKGREAGCPIWWEPGEKRKIFQCCITFYNINRTKRREPLRKGAGSGSKRYGRREFKTPLSPPTKYPPFNSIFLSVTNTSYIPGNYLLVCFIYYLSCCLCVIDSHFFLLFVRLICQLCLPLDNNQSLIMNR